MGPLAPLRTVLFTAGIATTVEAVRDVLGYTNITVVIEGQGTISGGVVTIEEACFNPESEAPYGGTWSALTTVNGTDVTGGAQKAVHLQVGAYSQIRVRISTQISGTGGAVSAHMVAV